MTKVPKNCEFGDPTCPCQDGDKCHYVGNNPWPAPSEEQKEIWRYRRALEQIANNSSRKNPMSMAKRLADIAQTALDD